MNTIPPVRHHRVRTAFDDTALFLLAVLFGLWVAAMRWDTGALPEPRWLFNLDQFTGAVACAALWLRRRHPVGLSVALVAVSSYSELAGGAMLVALFTVAVHRPPRVSGAVYGLSLLAALCYSLLRPEPDLSWSLSLLLGAVSQSAVVGWGLFVNHRRRLVESLRERALRAESEARLRAEQAQHLAREAIAREIHDVLGHRLSLLSVHAGALEYRPGAPPEDLARAAGVIRESAHQALQDLREVIGVLRAPVGELPQPTLADVRHLAAESGTAGMRVDLRQETDGTVPGAVGRTAYRVVQEALTNVRKHAPGAEVTVRLTGSPGEGLAVEVTNTPPDRPAAAAGGPAGRALHGPVGPSPDGAVGSAGNGVAGGVLAGDAGPVHDGVAGSATGRVAGRELDSVTEPVRDGVAGSAAGGVAGEPGGTGVGHSGMAGAGETGGAGTAKSGSAAIEAGGGGLAKSGGVAGETGGAGTAKSGSAVMEAGGGGLAKSGGVAGESSGGGAGRGLMGLGERVGLVGGWLEHGPTAVGGWRVVAWLPWPS